MIQISRSQGKESQSCIQEISQMMTISNRYLIKLEKEREKPKKDLKHKITIITGKDRNRSKKKNPVLLSLWSNSKKSMNKK